MDQKFIISISVLQFGCIPSCPGMPLFTDQPKGHVIGDPVLINGSKIATQKPAWQDSVKTIFAVTKGRDVCAGVPSHTLQRLGTG